MSIGTKAAKQAIRKMREVRIKTVEASLEAFKESSGTSSSVSSAGSFCTLTGRVGSSRSCRAIAPQSGCKEPRTASRSLVRSPPM